ncbi:hypothetical protein CQ043_24580 [Paenibacillus sp. MYb63]|nr:hypothetical protein CQ043_24580 [Paenibacillus sp. MYb63]PRA42385.1 hypothetical protein CQ061_29115 [Paenibacillus sp. MYb67]
MPNFRSKQESFPQACRGTSRESDAAGGEKGVKDALQRVLRHALTLEITTFYGQRFLNPVIFVYDGE